MLPKTQRKEKARIDQADHWERRCGKEKTNNCFYNDDLILNINIFYIATRPSTLDLFQLFTAGWLYDIT